MTTPLFLLPPDIIQNILGADETSHASLQHLRSLRAVGGKMRTAAEQKFLDPIWKAEWQTRATEFCDGLLPGGTLPAGAPHNEGLRVMLMQRDYNNLSRGMQEFMHDKETQQYILELLLVHVHDPNNALLSQQHARSATDNGMHLMVTQSMRFHPLSLDIQYDGIRVLEHLNTNRSLSVSDIKYIVETLVPLMHDNVNDLQIQRACLKIILDITDHGPRWIMVGQHNILTLIMQSIQTAPDNTEITRIGVQLLSHFFKSVNVDNDMQAMLVFDFGQAEDLLANAMNSHFTCAEIQSSCLNAWLSLNKRYPQRMRQQHTLLLEGTLNALTAHGMTEFIALEAIAVLLAVEPGFRELLPDSARTRSLLKGTELFPVILTTLSAQKLLNWRMQIIRKTVCTKALQLLYCMCHNNPENASFARRIHIVKHLSIIFSANVLDEIDDLWHYHLDRIELIIGE